MDKRTYGLMLLLSLSMISCAAPVKRGSIADVIARLDVTSYGSSIGPRREPDKHTFADYGLYPTFTSSTSAYLQPSDKSWYYGVDLLAPTANGDIRLCLTDRAENGGSYTTRTLLRLRQDSRGMLSMVNDTGDSPRCHRYGGDIDRASPPK